MQSRPIAKRHSASESQERPARGGRAERATPQTRRDTDGENREAPDRLVAELLEPDRRARFGLREPKTPQNGGTGGSGQVSNREVLDRLLKELLEPAGREARRRAAEGDPASSALTAASILAGSITHAKVEPAQSPAGAGPSASLGTDRIAQLGPGFRRSGGQLPDDETGVTMRDSGRLRLQRPIAVTSKAPATNTESVRQPFDATSS